MRVIKWIGITLVVVVALLAAGAVGLWVWKPWVPGLDVVDPGPTGRRVVENGIFANYFPGAEGTPHPGILLLGGSEGGLGNGGRRMAIELQSAGFAVLQLAYYRAPGQSPSLELVPLETFERALEWLKSQRGVDGGRLAVVGGSKGAEAALLVATRRADIRAVVVGAPSSVAWMGINWDYGGGSTQSSWSLAGKPVPALPYGDYDWNVGVLSVYQGGLRNLASHPDAIIAIERTRAPIMLVCGEADTLWPSCEMARQVEARAKAQGGPSVVVLAYKDAGHAGFGVPVPKTSPNYERLGSIGGTPDGNAAARADSWPKALAFLKEHLAAPAPAQ